MNDDGRRSFSHFRHHFVKIFFIFLSRAGWRVIHSGVHSKLEPSKFKMKSMDPHFFGFWVCLIFCCLVVVVCEGERAYIPRGYKERRRQKMIHIIAAGVLILPAALLIVATLPVVALLSIPALYLLLYRPPLPTSSSKSKSTTIAAVVPPPQQRRAIITGGSSGIGLCIAQECVKRGFAQVIILARNADKLSAAKKSLQKTALAKTDSSKNAKVTMIETMSVNVTDSQALVQAANQIFCPANSTKKNNGTVKKDDDESSSSATTAATITSTDSTPSCLSTYLFCCAGETHPTYFENLTCDQFATICATNQLGSIYTVHAVLPFMKQQQQAQQSGNSGGGGGGGGAIVFCSSMAGQVGVFGYTAYSPTKFAIRGFAEALHMELSCPSSFSSSSYAPIHVCVAYPPDTETPCYVKENITKPMETRLISADGGLCQPQHVARIMVDQVTERCNPPFAISFNFDGWMLSCLTAGFSPVTGLVDAVAQVAAGAVFRLVSLFYLQYWWYTLRQYRRSQTAKRDGDRVQNAKVDQSSSTNTATETTDKPVSSQKKKKTSNDKSS
jgi:3-dehydrosphinganine reductase